MIALSLDQRIPQALRTAASRWAASAGAAPVADTIAVVYAAAGAALSAGGAAVAVVRSRMVRSSFYADSVYHMTQRSHRRFAACSVLFAAGFLAALHWPVLAVPLLAIYTLLLVLYASSFARGFSGEDE